MKIRYSQEVRYVHFFTEIQVYYPNRYIKNVNSLTVSHDFNWQAPI